MSYQVRRRRGASEVLSLPPRRSLTILAFLLLLASPAARIGAQPPAAWRYWRVSGDLFTGIREDATERREARSETTGLNWGGNVDLHGFVVDPRFVVVDLGASFEDLETDVGRQETSARITGYRLQTRFLSERPWPFTLRVRGGDSDSTTIREDLESGFVTDYRTLGASWQLRLPNKPRVSLSYSHTTSSSIFRDRADSSSDNLSETLSANISHTWKEWTLRGGLFNTVTGFDFPGQGRSDRAQDQASFDAQRPFGDRGYLSLVSIYRDIDDSFDSADPLEPGVDTSTRESYLNGLLSYQHLERLTGSYSYTFSRTAIESSPAITDAESSSSESQQLTLGFRYEQTDRLSWIWDAGVQTFAFSGIADSFELPDRQVFFGPGVAYRRQLRSVNLSGSYRTVRTELETNLDNRLGTWSHVLTLGAQAGNRRRLQARAEYRFSDVPQITLVGAFDRQDRFRLRFLSARFEPFTLDATAALRRSEIVNFSGRQDRDDFDWSFGVQHPLFSLRVGQSARDGDGLIFEDPLDPDRSITDPLPLDSLIPSPLRLSTTRQDFARASLRPRPNLQLSASYLKTDDEFVVAPDREDERLDINLEYRLARVTLRGGYIRDESIVGSERIDRELHYLRLVRSFRFWPFR